MKRILLVAAGALGTAGLIAMAGPASAEEAAPQPRQSQLEQFGESIDPEKVVNEFLYGNCGAKLDNCPDPTKVSPRPGVLNQFDFFRRDLESQSETFINSIDPSNQLKKFVEGIPAPPTSDEDE